MEHDGPQEDFAGQFMELFWELRERNLSKWERLVAEEILIRSYGSNRASAAIGRLDALAGVLGLSRGNLHEHLSRLLVGNVLANDEGPGKHARNWWFKEIGLWDIARRIEPGTERAKRSEAGDAELREDNLPSDERPLPGFGPEQTDAEVQADANLGVGPSPARLKLSAAASVSASFGGEEKSRSGKWNRSGFRNANPVPESGTVPDSGTGEPDNALAGSGRPGFPEAWTEARQAGQSWSTEKAGGGRTWRELHEGEASLLFEMEDWFSEGPDTPEQTAAHRDSWKGRIRANSGLVRRCLLDAQQEVREKPDAVKKSRGGLLHLRYNQYLANQPRSEQRVAAKVPMPARAAVSISAPENPSMSWGDSQRRMAQVKEELTRQCRGGRP